LKRRQAARVLLVDDDGQIREAIATLLSSQGYEVMAAGDGEEAWTRFCAGAPNLVLTDVVMPKLDGIALMERIRERDPDIPILLLTAHGTVDMAITAMRLGAADFITKPFAVKDLLGRIRKSLGSQRGKGEEQAALARRKSDIIIGTSPGIRKVIDEVGMVAKSDVSAIIYGESGTGKEIAARTIHRFSPRREKPFITINCAALPETLLENELFGHVKGAYTGAHVSRKGLFEEANGGTLFLDEIGEIPPSIQVKLLHVLQSHEFKRVGDTKTIHVDLRTIFATNRDLRQLMQAETFREDLFYRINVVPITVPPLRERKEDIPLLVNHFMRLFPSELGKQIEGFTAEAMQKLMRYDWPGNVRELQNKIKQGIVTATDNLVTPRDILLPEETLEQRQVNIEQPFSEQKRKVIADSERTYLEALLRSCGHNVSKAARLGGMHRKNLYLLLRKHGLSPRKHPSDESRGSKADRARPTRSRR